MMKPVAVPLGEIYVPARLRSTLEAQKVEELAASIIENGLQNPIHVRRDKTRFVLVAGLHRLEAARALGEKTIAAFIVGAPQH
jgi:ParB-like chromosome segregation protein Spo0J